MSSMIDTDPGIKVVEAHMMDLKKYLPLTVVSGFCTRSLLYPVTLIRTRLQLQTHKDYYKGTFDAFRQISRNEGFVGLYKGFWISNLMVFSQMSYICTYEGVRHYLANNTDTPKRLKSFIGGGCASLVGQTFTVPIDIVSQHLQIIGTHKTKNPSAKFHSKLDLPHDILKKKSGLAKQVVIAVYKKEGLRGFYRGYCASLPVYVPNSAMWWLLYELYCDIISGIAPAWVPRLALQCLAAPLGGVTISFITNPLDAIRARIQVHQTGFKETTQLLWQEERMGVFTKGLSARLIQSVSFSFVIIFGYETIKRLSLLEEYKKDVRW